MHARYIIISLAEVSLCKLTSAKLIDTISGNEVSLIINVGAFEVCACTCICVYTHTRVPLTLAATASPFIHALIAKNALICVSKLTYTNINYSLRTGAKLCHKLTNQWLFNLRALLRYCDITRVRVEPSRWKHTLLAWASNLGYWCVSRVMDWGHALPIWKLNGLLSVRDTKAKALYYLILSAAAPLVLCGISKLVSSESLVFDTWFSSSLWCLSCLGWPNKTRELRLCVSASAVLTGYDIMFFWVLKMLLVSCFFVKGRLLFKNVIIHPIVCDALGQKMSKTKNNVINPKALFNSFGLEPVRLYFSGVDLSLQRFKMCLNTLLACRNISTKLWNIRRTIARRTSLSCVCYSLFCKWATTSLFVRIKRVAVALRTLNLNVYLNELLDAIKFDLNNCVALSQCACVVRLYDLVCWHYRAVLMRINTARFLNTRYNSAFVITLVVIHLLTLVSTANIVCTNCKRLFQQARPPAYTLMRSSVVYFNKIRVSACWQVFLWYGGLFVWR
ncbi:class I tRNA ligase family protein [Candidatus Hodgkinia cicadicola]